jgi:hypothetical protein
VFSNAPAMRAMRCSNGSGSEQGEEVIDSDEAKLLLAGSE